MRKETYNNLEELVVKQLEKHPKIEHGVNILKAALSSIPILGGMFSSLVSDYMPKIKIERLLKFTQNFGEDLKNFKDEIDPKYIKTEEFSYIFEKTYKAVMENYHKEKLDRYRAVLINSLRDKNTEQEKKEFFLKLLDNLTVTELSILANIIEIIEKGKPPWVHLKKLMEKTGDKDNLFVIANIKALELYNLVELDIQPNYTDYTIKYKRLGKDFINFISIK